MTAVDLGDLPERLQNKIVVAASGCWEWQAARDRAGYGIASKRYPTDTTHAHRRVYELLVAPILKDLTIDHLCRNK